jgi:DNA-binding CsgD family transcriptional regulator
VLDNIMRPSGSQPPGVESRRHDDKLRSELSQRRQHHSIELLDIRIRSALDALTPRERIVAAAFGEGQSYKEIAGQLGLSPATVRHYLREIYAKTHVSNKAELVHLLSNVAATSSADASMHAANASIAPAPT